MVDHGPCGEDRHGQCRRHDAQPSRARDRLALLDGLIAKGDPDELVTAAELAAEIDGMSMEFVCNVARWRGVVPMGSKPVTMRQYYRSTGKTVVKTRPLAPTGAATCSPRCKAAPTSRPSGSRTSVPARRSSPPRRSAIPSRWAATSTRSAYGALDQPEQELPVDPYVLGCWLGDGHSVSAQFYCADSEILANIESAGFEVRAQAWSRYAWGIIGLRKGLRHLGVLQQQACSRGLPACGTSGASLGPHGYRREQWANGQVEFTNTTGV